MKNLFFTLFAVLLLASCGGGAKFEQVGYFKDDNKNRVITIYIENADDATLEKIGKKQMHTNARLTKVYFYNDKQHAKNVTLCSDLDHAIVLGCNENCIAVFSHYPIGQTELIMKPDCAKE